MPSAAITLRAAVGLAPTGLGAVCYRPAGGAAFAQAEQEIVELLRGAADAPDVRLEHDEFGFTWLVVDDDPDDPDGVAGLVTDLHAVNTTLESHGFGPGLLCSLVPFVDAAGRRVGLVYLYKQGTFYPFAPQAGRPGTVSRPPARRVISLPPFVFPVRLRHELPTRSLAWSGRGRGARED